MRTVIRTFYATLYKIFIHMLKGQTHDPFIVKVPSVKFVFFQ